LAYSTAQAMGLWRLRVRKGSEPVSGSLGVLSRVRQSDKLS